MAIIIQPRQIAKMKKSFLSLKTLETIGSLLLIVAAWQVLVSLGIGGLRYIPSPIEVFSQFTVYAASGAFVLDLSISMKRIASGFILGVVTGIPVGILMGWRLAFKTWVFPTFEILRPIPPLAWIPLAVIIFANVEDSITFIIWTGAFFPIVLNTMLGVNNIPEQIKRSCLSLGISQKQMLRHVVIPAAIPAIITGMTLGMGIAWDQLVAAEMLAGGSGVGYQLWYFYIIENYAKVMMFMIIIGLVGYAFSITIRSIARQYMKWNPKAG